MPRSESRAPNLPTSSCCGHAATVTMSAVGIMSRTRAYIWPARHWHRHSGCHWQWHWQCHWQCHCSRTLVSCRRQPETRTRRAPLRGGILPSDIPSAEVMAHTVHWHLIGGMAEAMACPGRWQGRQVRWEGRWHDGSADGTGKPEPDHDGMISECSRTVRVCVLTSIISSLGSTSMYFCWCVTPNVNGFKLR